MWRVLGDAGPTSDTKARQNHIGAVRTKACTFASNGGGKAMWGEGQDLVTPSREGQG